MTPMTTNQSPNKKKLGNPAGHAQTVPQDNVPESQREIEREDSENPVVSTTHSIHLREMSI